MSLKDLIADFLTRLRNAYTAGHRHTDVMRSKPIQSMAVVLKSTGFIEQYIVREDGKNEMRLFLKYNAMRKPIGLKRISLPGRRRYVGADHITSVFNGLGISIISTSQGILSSHEALKKHVGGEVLFYVW
ncbi:hypothetical protein ACTFIW_012110 [Dictyostelium discoideum]